MAKASTELTAAETTELQPCRCHSSTADRLTAAGPADISGQELPGADEIVDVGGEELVMGCEFPDQVGIRRLVAGDAERGLAPLIAAKGDLVSRAGIVVGADPFFIREGKFFSSAGITAGIDLALALVEEDHGARFRTSDRAISSVVPEKDAWSGAVFGRTID